MATPKIRAIRVHDAAWSAAKDRAAGEGRSLSDVVNDFLEQYGGTPSERRAPAQL